MQEGQVASFILKLSEMLQSPKLSHIIRWTPEGDSFEIVDSPQLTKSVLPKYFKHPNFRSFVRQLNMYNFTKVRSAANQMIYRNDYFVRGGKAQYHLIKRKTPGKKREDQCEGERDQENSAQPVMKSLIEEVRELSERNQRLENTCKNIFNQNYEVIRENAKMRKIVNKAVEQRSKQASALLYLLLMKSGNQKAAQCIPFANNRKFKFDEDADDSNLSDDSENSEQGDKISKNFSDNILKLLKNRGLQSSDILSCLEENKKTESGNKKLRKELKNNEDSTLYIKENGQSNSNGQRYQSDQSEDSSESNSQVQEIKEKEEHPSEKHKVSAEAFEDRLIQPWGYEKNPGATSDLDYFIHEMPTDIKRGKDEDEFSFEI